MGFFSSKGGGSVQQAPGVQDAKEEKESAVKKARLTGTEGGNKGAILNATQGGSIRKIFGS